MSGAHSAVSPVLHLAALRLQLHQVLPGDALPWTWLIAGPHKYVNLGSMCVYIYVHVCLGMYMYTCIFVFICVCIYSYV